VSGAFDKTAIAHYKAREWSPAVQAFKNAKGTRSADIAEDVRKLGQLWVSAEMDRSMDLNKAIREYDEALTLDKKLPFSKGYHAPYLMAQLQKLTRAAATAAYAAGNYEQAASAVRYAQKYSPNDPGLGKLVQDLDGKAKELVQRGLSLKDSNPEQAKLLFRSVVKFAPKSSPSYQKAYQTLNAMAKPMQDEDE
jgi:tetratricopeptide (TPR) repeat protein